MSDGVTYLTLIIGFGFVIVAGARLGAGSPGALAGLFAAHGQRDWPTGIQEGDAPRFAVSHLDGLRHDQPITVDVAPIAPDDPIDTPRSELVELGSRRFDTRRS